MEKIMRINRINNFFSKIIFKCFNCQALSLFFFSILFHCFARADAPNPTDKDILNVFDNVDQSFLAIAKSWVDTGEHYAKSLFFWLALINILWSGIKYVIYKQEVQEIFTELVVTLISLCGFLTIIQYAPTWMDSIFLKSFESLGAHVTNINTWIVECDKLSKAEQMELINKSPIVPSLIIESNKSYHIYFFAKD